MKLINVGGEPNVRLDGFGGCHLPLGRSCMDPVGSIVEAFGFERGRS